MIKYGFSFTDENGNKFKMENEVEIFSELGNDDLDELGRAFNKFLGQIGYDYKFKNDFVLMESLTDEEYDYLELCLRGFRKEQ